MERKNKKELDELFIEAQKINQGLIKHPDPEYPKTATEVIEQADRDVEKVKTLQKWQEKKNAWHRGKFLKHFTFDLQKYFYILILRAE
jgi:vacuolar-type H+-ATPase subunit H